MALNALKALTAAALLAATTAASAGTAPFNLVSGATAPGIDVNLTIQESTVAGYDYDFVVSNSSLMGIVTGVYFEIDWNSVIPSTGVSSGPAALNLNTLSPDIPGWTGSKESHTVGTTRVRQLVGRHFQDFYYDDLGDGIQEGESQVFSFVAGNDGVTLDTLTSLLATSGYGVAIRVQGLTEDEQAAGFGLAEEREDELLVVQALRQDFDNDNQKPEVTAVPTPTAGLAGLALLGLTTLRRRRK